MTVESGKERGKYMRCAKKPSTPSCEWSMTMSIAIAASAGGAVMVSDAVRRVRAIIIDLSQSGVTANNACPVETMSLFRSIYSSDVLYFKKPIIAIRY
jgi:hypothetical protein